MFTDVIEFETSYGPGYVVYRAPEPWDRINDVYTQVRVSQVLVKCPGHIVWDSNGKWWPEPQVVDEALPRARAVCELLGIPAYRWLDEVRRQDIWAIERDFQRNQPVSMMMDFAHEDDYDGIYAQRSNHSNTVKW